jgi:para-aminobenzoate synthetase component 1
MTLLFEELPYRSDPIALFDGIADEPWSLLLDSGQPSASGGRYDILCADPRATLIMHNGVVTVTERGREPHTAPDLFNAVRQLLDPVCTTVPPFAGGMAGYLGYDLGRRLEGLAVPPTQAPEAALGIYDWAVVIDHEARRAWMAGLGREPRTRERWQERVERFRTAEASPPAPFAATGPVTSNLEREAYARAFAQVQRHIRDGDCYQVNLARRFRVPVEGSAWSAYRRLRAINGAPFSAWMNLPGLRVLSVSPERFLRVEGRRVTTTPIKGTRPRCADRAEDAAQAEALRNSAKDRAENLMIVDLLRNDLGKCCVTGSVAVPALFQVESFATVHHLVSTVTGELRTECDALDLLAACLPGGSITGAPKHRVLEIIEALEPDRREVYCGAIGYLGADGRLDTNVAIRTLVHADGEMRFWAGGGIIADSIMELEFEETEHKAAGMRRLFE